MIIDGHSHVTLPIEDHINEMDRTGVSKTVLFSTTFHPEKANNTAEVIKEMTYLNELLSGKKGSMIEARKKSLIELTEAIKKYPNRYVGFGAVPIGLEYEQTRDYINRYIYQKGLVGLGEFTLESGSINQLLNIFKASQEISNLPIWIHAFNPLTLKDIKEIAILAKKYVNIPVILGHLGGSNWIETMNLVKEIPNLYLDISAYFSTFVLGIVINEIPNKCIFGVDRPYGDIELMRDAVLKVSSNKDIANMVLGNNIARLLDM